MSSDLLRKYRKIIENVAEGSDDDLLSLAKRYAELMGYDPNDMDEINPVVNVMKANPQFLAMVKQKVNNQDASRQPFGEANAPDSDAAETDPAKLEMALDEFKELKDQFDTLIEQLEQAIRFHIPERRQELDAYMLGSLKSVVGGHGYSTRNTTLEDIIEDLEGRLGNQEGDLD